jgi:cytochrome c biogenesis protein CcmG/thiol:disulfide interchange protein DsbE
LKPRFLIPLGVFAALVVVLAVGIKHSPEVGVLQSPLVGHQIPDWELPLLTDPSKTLGSRELKGQWYVLNYWGTWCVACREEHAALLAAQRDARVQIIGVDWKTDNPTEDADALEWLAKLGNPYRQVVSDHDGRTAIDLGVAAAPESFLVNPAGVIVFKQPMGITPEVWKREFLSRLPPHSTVPPAAPGAS